MAFQETTSTLSKLLMSDYKILDCTLRDGGYYTNWDFDDRLVKEYYTAMESLPIDYVEIGYRSVPLNSYLGKFFYCPEYVMEEAKKYMPSKKLAILLNEKDVGIKDLNYLLDPCKKYIDLVRVAVDPSNFKRAIELAKVIKEAGFEVAFNVMYMSSWNDHKDFLKELPMVNDLVNYFYMVDSFGGVLPAQVREITNMLKNNLSVPFGFHGHNNLELGLINSLTAIEAGCSIIDSTITGMGRGAGNLKTELLLTYLSSEENKYKFSFTELSKIVSSFEELQKHYEWGTNLPYMISGANSLPQKEVMSWISKRRYSISGIVNALQNRKDKISDNLEVPDFIPTQTFEKTILIGGGNSALSHFEAIRKVLENNNEFSSACVIHASTRYAQEYHQIGIPQYYCLIGNEGHRLKNAFDNLALFNHKCVLPPFPRDMGTFIPEDIKSHTVQLREVTFTDSYVDSPLTIALQTALEIKSKEIILVGFDGYDVNINRTQVELSQENQHVLNQALKVFDNIKFWTPTKYNNIPQHSVYSLLK